MRRDPFPRNGRKSFVAMIKRVKTRQKLCSQGNNTKSTRRKQDLMRNLQDKRSKMVNIGARCKRRNEKMNVRDNRRNSNVKYKMISAQIRLLTG